MTDTAFDLEDALRSTTDSGISNTPLQKLIRTKGSKTLLRARNPIR
jgi:hypothetical protein